MEVTPQNQRSLENGLEATRSQLDALMEEMGVERISPDKGSVFDERRHRAVGLFEEGGREGTISSVERVGFEYEGEMIRRADVVVNGTDTLVEEWEE